jgi:mono/diheme cytochrome c family protein
MTVPRDSFSIAVLFAIGVWSVAFVGARSAAQNNNDGAVLKKNSSTYVDLKNAPQKARARKNPFESDPEAVLAGGKLFDQHCARCHGKKAGGTRYGVSLLNEEVQQATAGTLFWVLTNGMARRGMPVWSKLPEPERWQIVTFLQSLAPQSLKAGTPDPVRR